MMESAEIRLRCLELAARAHPTNPTGWEAFVMAEKAIEFVLPPDPRAAPVKDDDLAPF